VKDYTMSPGVLYFAPDPAVPFLTVHHVTVMGTAPDLED
jgi:hypothetical protein